MSEDSDRRYVDGLLALAVIALVIFGVWWLLFQWLPVIALAGGALASAQAYGDRSNGLPALFLGSLGAVVMVASLAAWAYRP